MTLTMRLCLRLAVIGLLGGGLPATTDAKTLIHAGRLIDGRADTARTSVTVTVDGDRIVSIADGYADARAPATRSSICKNATLMPGLMDMHVHLSSETSGAAGYAERFFLNPADFALRATTYASKTLLAGFTTVRDCGAGDKLNLALRDAIAKGWIKGPRIVAAGVGDHDRRPRRRHQRPGDGAAGGAGADAAGHGQRARPDARRRPAALQGRRGLHQDRRHRRRVEPGQERSGAAVHRRGTRGRRRRPPATTAWMSPRTRTAPRACCAPSAPACTRSSTAPT